MIALAASAAERAAVFALRYDVIACEQGGAADASIDSGNRTVIDPADAAGCVFAAWVEGRLAGTVRVNLLRDGPAMPYCRLLGLADVPDAERRLVSVTSRLVVAARWRGTPLFVRLCQAATRHSLAAGLSWDYIVVRPQVAPLYARLGYRSAGTAVDFPGVGSLVPLRLRLDRTHLRDVHSILVDGWSEHRSAGRRGTDAEHDPAPGRKVSLLNA
jgi:hypothetical protein